jgi:hypothetical protein
MAFQQKKDIIEALDQHKIECRERDEGYNCWDSSALREIPPFYQIIQEPTSYREEVNLYVQIYDSHHAMSHFLFGKCGFPKSSINQSKSLKASPRAMIAMA